MKTKIIIVDDHPVVRQGMKMFIETDNSFEVCGEASNTEEAIKLINDLSPDVAIIDLSLGEEKSGLDLIKAIKQRFQSIKSLVLSMHDEELYAERALKAGARGYVMKKEAQENIIRAIKKIISGGIYLSENISEKILNEMICGSHENISDPSKLLSNREFEIFQFIGQGLNSKEISIRMNITKNTVDSHKRHIKEKLNLKNSTELMKKAVEFSIKD